MDKNIREIIKPLTTQDDKKDYRYDGLCICFKGRLLTISKKLCIPERKMLEFIQEEENENCSICLEHHTNIDPCIHCNTNYCIDCRNKLVKEQKIVNHYHMQCVVCKKDFHGD